MNRLAEQIVVDGNIGNCHRLYILEVKERHARIVRSTTAQSDHFY